MKDHFLHIFWFIVGLCLFGMGLTIFLIVYLPTEDSKRIADNAMIFWLTSAVGGGLGYLIGSSAKSVAKPQTDPLTNSENGTTI